ncbi:MAG: nucleotide exchange factor GrpE, partial [Terracidiphilus sp.]
MPEQKAEVTVMDSPEAAAGSLRGEPNGAAIDPAAELPAPTAEESAEATAEIVSRAEFNRLKAERDQLVDRLARLQADFENARKRSERERTEFRDYATGNVIEQFLPVLDHFELALKATGS